MAKIGRNQLCPCGGGKKYKHCHGSITLSGSISEQFVRLGRQAEAKRQQREKQQGFGRPIVSTEFKGDRVVAVGNTVYRSVQWKSFHDFLRTYIVQKLDIGWFNAEQVKPFEQRHPIVRWYDQATNDFRRNSVNVGKVYKAPMTGAQRAFLNLAYNIYLIDHHATEAPSSLLSIFIAKLKSERLDDFIGKLFETYAAAAFLKAGFHLSFEDESDGNVSHVEFVATYPETGRKFSVEVKSRNRAVNEDGPVDDIKRLRVGNKLNRALAKKADHTRIVIIEINVPDIVGEKSLEGWPRAALSQIREAEKWTPSGVDEKPKSYVIVTNHAFHNNLEAVDVGAQVLAAGCRIPDFGVDAQFNSLKAVLESERNHQEVLALIDSMRQHYEIPSTFDGQNPELAFQSGMHRGHQLKLGEVYFVPGPDGKPTAGRLVDAIVNESDQTVVGIYETLNDKFIAISELSDIELAAWKRHPETFFGEIQQQNAKVENWLELAKVFYQTYRNTPRNRLLDWMKNAADFEELSKFSQADLAIVYCERTAFAAMQRQE